MRPIDGFEALVERVASLGLPMHQAVDLRKAFAAGEERLALEAMCVQIHEYSISLPIADAASLAALCERMQVDGSIIDLGIGRDPG